MTRVPSLPIDLNVVPIAEAWTTGTLVAAAGNTASAFIDLSTRDSIRVVRTATGGVYAFEIDWSRDGVAVDVVEAVTIANNTSARRDVAARYARFRVRNTDATVAFTAHRTTVSIR